VITWLDHRIQWR